MAWATQPKNIESLSTVRPLKKNQPKAWTSKALKPVDKLQAPSKIYCPLGLLSPNRFIDSVNFLICSGIPPWAASSLPLLAKSI